MEIIRVLVIDDQEVFRLGLRVTLDRYQDIAFDCEAADGPSGLVLAAERRPDVAVIDLWLPGMDGVEVAQRMRAANPQTRIILVSGCFDDAAINRGVELGVDGIISKTDPPAQFADFIREVHRGEFCCSATVMEAPLVRLAVPFARIVAPVEAGVQASACAAWNSTAPTPQLPTDGQPVHDGQAAQPEG